MRERTMQISNCRRERGATLIESLVSLVILAIAVIGMLGVQVRTMMDTNTAAGRTQAMLLIDDLSERIKANPAGYQALSSYEMTETASPPAAACDAAPCSSADLVNYDKTQWLQNFKNSMPGARVATFVSQDNTATTGTRQLGVLIGWTLREKDTAETSSYTKNFFVDKDKVNTGLTDVDPTSGCWIGFICHLAYIEP
jgi:type IV pilus assembly protein PilV